MHWHYHELVRGVGLQVRHGAAVPSGPLRLPLWVGTILGQGVIDKVAGDRSISLVSWLPPPSPTQGHGGGAPGALLRGACHVGDLCGEGEKMECEGE